MPVYNPNNSSGNSGNRSTFRPPWVKEGPTPLPMPTAPWNAKSREQNAASTISNALEPKIKPILKKQSKITTPAENGQNIPIKIERPTLKKIPQQQPQSEKVIPIKIESKKTADSAKPPAQPPSWRKERQSSVQQSPKPPQPINTMNQKPPPPPMPPAPPPPPPGLGKPEGFEKKPMTKERAQKLEALRSRPRRRPDWTDMMKEVESGKKLKHVQCNDRSAPIIPKTKAKEGQFVYDSEKKPDEDRDKLLKQIQGGVKLRKVKCNDRSKPNLDGLRRFRRQITQEEKIQKSVSMADVVAAATDPEDLDDIDKVRDDLQSAKQMLALELRNKEALERENKRLAARLANLEAELEKEKSLRKTEAVKGQAMRTSDDEKLIVRLKEEAAEADKIAKEMEAKYHTTAEELDNTRRKLESAWLRNQELETQLSAVCHGAPVQPLAKQPSRKIISAANGESIDLISDDEEESESESEEENEPDPATGERKICKELRLLTTKLRTFREKQVAALKERRILREHLIRQQKEMKEEKRKYKLLQKEVDKISRLMREAEDDEYEDHNEENDDEEESESESESEESEEEEKSDGEIPANATPLERKKILMNRIKRHENRLSSLSKGNCLIKANIGRLQDDVNKQREMSAALQEDLNNILADFG